MGMINSKRMGTYTFGKLAIEEEQGFYRFKILFISITLTLSQFLYRFMLVLLVEKNLKFINALKVSIYLMRLRL